MRVDVLGKLFPLWVEGLEAAGAHAGVFGGIERSPELYDDFVEFVEQLQGFLTAVGKVEGEGQAWPREGEHAWRWDIAKFFENGKE